jgi:tRNA pseudouridine38-40 synthase
MRIALGIEYNGAGFYGWQAQANLPTIQGSLESALANIADQPCELFCAGRTDAGVHATGQIVHFDAPVERNRRAWIMGTNSHLPPTIAVRWAQLVSDDFHARYSAMSRSYRYIIYNHRVRSAIFDHRATWYYEELNVATMQQASQYLIGELDFSSFRSSQCESKSPMRNVQRINVNRFDDFVVIEIKANAFLHHMVRNIAGVLMRVGAGYQEPEWVLEVLQAKDRRKAVETASPHGLYLCEVNYPTHFSLPVQSKPLLFF